MPLFNDSIVSCTANLRFLTFAISSNFNFRFLLFVSLWLSSKANFYLPLASLQLF